MSYDPRKPIYLSRGPRRAHARSLPPYAEGDRATQVAIVVAVLAFLSVLASRVYADPIEETIRARVEAALPAGLGVARVYLPPPLAALDVDPGRVVVELPRELRAGRPSIKLTVRGRAPAYVPVAIAALTDVAIAQRELAAGDVVAEGDIAIERRAVAELAPAAVATLVGATVTRPLTAGAPIAARDVSLPPPLARGTQVAVDVRRGALHIRGTATLEAAARPGDLASARLAATRTIVRGRLVSPATLLVGDPP